MKHSPLFLLHSLILASLLSGIPFLNAAQLVGVDETGAPLAYGSGWDGKSTSPHYIAPLVDDDGTATFIAPLHTLETCQPSVRALYQALPDGSFLLNPGYNESLVFFGYKPEQCAETNLTLASDAFHSTVYSYRNVMDVNGYADTQTIWNNTDARDYVDAIGLSTSSSLSISGDGLFALLADPDCGCLLYDIGNDFQEVTLPSALDDANGINGSLLDDGSLIVYTVSSQNNTDDLRATHRTTQETVTIAQGILSQNNAVAVANGTKTLAFVTQNTEYFDTSFSAIYGPQIVLAFLDEESNTWYTQWCHGDFPLYECSSPTLSADGRFVAFTASKYLNGNVAVFRYDSLTGNLIQASDETDATCRVPALSPNGRFVAYVLRDNSQADSLAQVYTNDLGITLDTSKCSLEINSSTTELPILISGTSENATLTLTWDASVQPLGTFFIKDTSGTEIPVTSGTSISANSLPIYFTPTPDTTGNGIISVTLTDGTLQQESTFKLILKPENLPAITLISATEKGELPSFAHGFPLQNGSCAINEDGTWVAFNSTAQLVEEDGSSDVDLYLKNNTTGALTLITDNEEFTSAVSQISISDDGSLLFFIHKNCLYQHTIATAENTRLLTNVTTAVAPSRDGSILALLIDGIPHRWSNGEASPLTQENGFTSPMISSDGNVLAFMKENACYLYTQTEGFRLLAQDLSSPSLILDGSAIIAIQNNTLRRFLTDGTSEEIPFALPETITPSDLLALTTTRGRYLLYARKINGKYQAVRYDLKNQTETTLSINETGEEANATIGSPMSLSTDGQSICFPTVASNLVDGKNNLIFNELYMARFTENDNQLPTLTTTQFKAEEKDTGTFVFDLTITSPCLNGAIPEITQTTAQGELSFLPPSSSHPWYQLAFTPESPHFCGTIDIAVTLWDGMSYSENQSITATIENLNDPPSWQENLPQEITFYQLQENTQLSSQHFTPFVVDPDLANPAPWQETLTFSLLNPLPWMTIEGDQLLLTPDFDVARKDIDDGLPLFTPTLVVTDSAGASAQLTLSIRVLNVNRPPSISPTIQELAENSPLAWDSLALSDEDIEDTQETLTLILTYSGNLVWKNSQEETVDTSCLHQADFPIHFSSQNEVNTLDCTLQAKDLSAGVSESAHLPLQMAQVNLPLSSFWDSQCFPVTYPNWCLLSLPCEAAISDIKIALGTDQLWIWEANGYTTSCERLQAQRGFIVYLTTAPDLTTCLQGKRTDSPFSPTKGWNLIAPTQNQPLFKSENNRLQKENQTPHSGKGYWFFK